MRSFVFLLLLLFPLVTTGQVIINEASNRNYTQISDSEFDTPDWIELYNLGPDQNMEGYYLSDNKSNLKKWPFSAMVIPQNKWLFLFASDKGNASGIHHWETAVRDSELWHWTNPTSTTSNVWMQTSFNDTNWQSGFGGFGFGDEDDATTFPTTRLSVYARKSFSIADTSVISAAILHMDYDDGFVAYLNGQEIARANVSGSPTWNTLADESKEANLYQGMKPDEFKLDMHLIKSVWKQGENVLAIHVMNESEISTDLTARAFLSFGIADEKKLFGTPPYWFDAQRAGNIHTNFKIDKEGETIYLSHADTIVDSLSIPNKMPLNASYGRTQDGATTTGIFMTATPGASNNSQVAYTKGLAKKPSIDKPSGFYAAPITVSLTSDTPGQIRYTLGGETPDENNSIIYTTPITLGKSQVLSARTFSTTGELPSDVLVKSFFINEEQTDAGVLCITTDNKNLFGSQGIYDNWGSDWKKPCYIEYFAPGTHAPTFEQRAGLRIDGGAGGSRSQPQRSFRVEPGNGTLGDGDLKYPLIPSRPSRNTYETFYLRNGSNQYLYYPCKDAIETKCLAHGTDIPYAAYTPVQVYLNGKYWGWYELREKQDADYFLQNYGIEKDELELCGASFWYGGSLRSIDGKNAAENFYVDYNALLKLSASSPTYYEDANKRFDLEKYIDYICMESWICNIDWPTNNIKIFRGPQTDNKWRFGVIDVEWALQPNGWTSATFDHIGYMKTVTPDCPYIRIWQKSIENNTFKTNFINRFADLMNTNWHKDSVRAIANEIYQQTRPEMTREFSRWSSPTNAPYMLDNFDAAHQSMLNELTYRSTYVRNHLMLHFDLGNQVSVTLDVSPKGAGKIKISTVTPSTYPWSGIYFQDLPVTIEAIPNPGFTFQKWDGNNVILSSMYNKRFSGKVKQASTFKAYFVADKAGPKITISEINYAPSTAIDAGDWIEFWNYAQARTTDLSGWYFTNANAGHRFTFPANTILPPDHGIIVVNNAEKFRSNFPAVPHLAQFNFDLTDAGDIIRLYNANDSLVAEVAYTGASPWPTGANGTGRTLELLAPNMPVGDAASWATGCIGGSPGYAFSSPCIITSVNDDVSDGGIVLYPNPTTGKFVLSSEKEMSQASIIDFNGRIIYAANIHVKNHEIDLTDASQGIYFLKIILRDGKQQTIKVARK